MVDILKAREKAKKSGKKESRKQVQELKNEAEVSPPSVKKEKKRAVKKTVIPDAVKERKIKLPKEPEKPVSVKSSQETDIAEVAADDALEFLAFKLGDETYAIHIDTIDEIIVFHDHTPVPNTAEYLSGILSLRGRMIPILDGRVRLGHSAGIPDENTRIVVVRTGEEHMGIIVDSVQEVITINEKQIEDPPSVISGIEADYLKGVCNHKNELVIILDFERFLTI